MVALNKYFKDDYLLFTTFQYYSVPFLYLVAYFCIKNYENPFVSIWIAYSFIPLLDEVVSMDVRNPTKTEEKILENQLRFKLPIYISLVIDWVFTIFVLNTIANNEFNLFKFIGYIAVLSNMAASNINIAHELMHKNNSLDKFLGHITLSKNMYMYFYIEHVHGHHRNVATPIDPATSKLNQTIYEFLPQTLVGSLKSAWGIEKKRLLDIEKEKSMWTYKNRMIYYGLNNIILPILVWKIWGTLALILFLLQAILGILILENINYIEHYGLQRKEISPGVYEKVNIQHSWNTSHRISNYFLFKLQRHSDHHENGFKPYQILSTFDESPQLPHGYTCCMIIAWFPKLWFRVMNEYVGKYTKGVEIGENVIEKMHQEVFTFLKKVSFVLFIAMIFGFLI